MKYLTILVILAFNSFSSVWASSCPANRPLDLIHTATLYPNSVMWLNHAQDAIALTAQPIQPSSSQSIPLNQAIDPITQLVKYTPMQHFMASEHYQISATQKKDTEKYSVENQIEISTPTQLATLQWLKKPVFTGYEISEDDPLSGVSGQMTFTLQTNFPPDDYLVLVHILNSKKYAGPHHFILQPSASTDSNQPNTTNISMGFSICQSTLLFEENEELLAKFDLISHDGKIIPWQGDPIKVHIQKNPSTAIKVQETPPQGWWQKIKQWFFDKWEQLFS